MSFAGEVRPVVEAVKKYLQEAEVEVFYDFDEQHRILARDVEEYLAPIYRTEARYVVVFLSEEYPRKVWTKFESRQFKDRFGDKSVVPVWFKNVPLSAFDLTSTLGGLVFDQVGDLEEQARTISGVLLRKLEEERADEAALIKREHAKTPANDEGGLFDFELEMGSLEAD